MTSPEMARKSLMAGEKFPYLQNGSRKLLKIDAIGKLFSQEIELPLERLFIAQECPKCLSLNWSWVWENQGETLWRFCRVKDSFPPRLANLTDKTCQKAWVKRDSSGLSLILAAQNVNFGLSAFSCVLNDIPWNGAKVPYGRGEIPLSPERKSKTAQDWCNWQIV